MQVTLHNFYTLLNNKWGHQYNCDSLKSFMQRTSMQTLKICAHSFMLPRRGVDFYNNTSDTERPVEEALLTFSYTEEEGVKATLFITEQNKQKTAQIYYFKD